MNYQLISTIHIVVSRKCSDHLTIHLVLLSSSVCRLEGRRPTVFASRMIAVDMCGTYVRWYTVSGDKATRPGSHCNWLMRRDPG